MKKVVIEFEYDIDAEIFKSFLDHLLVTKRPQYLLMYLDNSRWSLD